MAPPPRPPLGSRWACARPTGRERRGRGRARARPHDGCAPARGRATGARARAAGAGFTKRPAAAAEPDVSAKMAGRVSAGPEPAARGGGAGLAGTPRSGRPQGRGSESQQMGGWRGRQAREGLEGEKGERWQGIALPQKLHSPKEARGEVTPSLPWVSWVSFNSPFPCLGACYPLPPSQPQNCGGPSPVGRALGVSLHPLARAY